MRGKRAFLTVLSNHHGDGRFAVWCAAPEGVQAMLVDADPEPFFVPPYVGHRGWLGVRLDRGLQWDELTGIAEDAYAEVAPARLVEAARAAAGEPLPASAARARRGAAAGTEGTRRRREPPSPSGGRNPRP